MITVGSVVIRPGGTRQWRVLKVYQELMSHRQMLQIQPIGDTWVTDPISLPLESVREVPPDIEDFPAA